MEPDIHTKLAGKDPLDGDTAELTALAADFAGSIRRRLILWAIRWAIGFSIIGIVVVFDPRWAWLWWAGIGLAILTPVTTMVVNWIIRRQVRNAEIALAELKDAFREADGD